MVRNQIDLFPFPTQEAGPLSGHTSFSGDPLRPLCPIGRFLHRFLLSEVTVRRGRKTLRTTMTGSRLGVTLHLPFPLVIMLSVSSPEVPYVVPSFQPLPLTFLVSLLRSCWSLRESYEIWTTLPSSDCVFVYEKLLGIINCMTINVLLYYCILGSIISMIEVIISRNKT